MIPRDWRAIGETHEVRGRRVFCARAGVGEPLLLLHAYPTASWGFHRIWPSLIQHFDVIAPDLPGSGFSDKPNKPVYDIANLTDIVQALLERFGIERVHVLAHAYGVTVAQELLARSLEGEPDRPRSPRIEPRSICFINGGLFVEGTRPTVTQKLLLSPIGPLMARWTPTPYTVFRRKITRAFGSFNPPKEEDFRAIWTLLRHNDGHTVVPLTLRYLRERSDKRERWVGALEGARIPMCLVNGAADPVAGEDVPRIWSRMLPEAPLIQLDPRIGHYPPLEDPQGTLDAFNSFMRTHVETSESGAS